MVGTRGRNNGAAADGVKSKVVKTKVAKANKVAEANKVAKANKVPKAIKVAKAKVVETKRNGGRTSDSFR